MSKKLIVGLALAVVLFSGPFAVAHAECNFCLPHIVLPCLGSCNAAAIDRDYDKPDATCQGARQYGPFTPDVMSGVTGW